MLFNSTEFALFFPLVALLYFGLPHKIRWALLLAASCAFYMFFIPKYIFILLLTILVDYSAAIYIEDHQGRRRKAALVISIISTCLILAVFKYYNFFLTNVSQVALALHLNYNPRLLNIILPIGLSFHTFQSLSYVIEVYRGNQKAERHFGIYSLYVMFFPQLVAGPIERPQNVIHQLHENQRFDFPRVRRGLQLMAWGLFKKVVIADRLSFFVSQVFGNPQSFFGLTLIVATIFFAFQIYCDFSGYSDIAIGCAEVLGVKLMTNFRRPYFSVTVAEFWKRWHISLSTWFRDYLYIPLGGNRGSHFRWQCNLLFTFLVSGFWHGANWTFVVWGGLNGLYLIGENWFTGFPQGVFLPLRRLLTFSLICLTWVFFRANSLRDALYIIGHFFSGTEVIFLQLFQKHSLWGLHLFPISIQAVFGCFFCIFGLLLVEWQQEKRSLRDWVETLPGKARWSLYYCGILGLYFFGVYGDNQFIYFQF